MPLEGEDMTLAETHLGFHEAFISVSGTYEDLAHDISFENLNLAHTTWLRVGSYGYADQQTGGYIGANVIYPAFEAVRSHWYQNPGGIQTSAAHNIQFTGGSYTQIGAGGFGIGQDPNACISGIDLGAKNITISKEYFTQVMGNGVTAGVIQIPAHHPNDSSMINSGIHVTENIFWNMSSLFSSCVPILYTYVQYSIIVNNDVYYTTYSGICHGYGWGMNEAGGSDIYVGLRTYKYQHIFTTPTTLMNHIIKGNLVHGYGFSHTDLGAIYTLSKSPSTYFLENYAFNATWNGFYTDEGSNSIIFINNSMMEQGGHGFGSGTMLNPGMHTANNTFIDNFGEYEPGRDFTDAPNGTGIVNNTFLRNFVVDAIIDTDTFGQRVAPVTNPPVSERYAALIFPELQGEVLEVDVWNFDDMDYIDVSFKSSIGHAKNSPSTIPADGHILVNWQLPPLRCKQLEIEVTIKYTNSRTGDVKSNTVSGNMPGLKPLDELWSTSSTWPATLGTYDDWAVIYKALAIGSDGSVSANVISIDGISPHSSAGVAIRDSFQSDSPSNDANHVNSTGYAAVFITTLTALATILPTELRLNVSYATFSGSYCSPNDSSWVQIGSAVQIPRKASNSDAGMIANSHGGYRSGTAIFGDIAIL
ncbi:hypothetical protein M433DRAFT_135628 [Acidomyces richmondensis BFW]|nr:hypothetical protein M433DRAFT_135628 [Acidomyces richmondensis BFW]